MDREEFDRLYERTFAPLPCPLGWADWDPFELEDGRVVGRRVYRRPKETEAHWRARRRGAVEVWLGDWHSGCDAALVMTELGRHADCHRAECRRARACMGRRPPGSDIATWPSELVPPCLTAFIDVERMMVTLTQRNKEARAWLDES